jgi:hypothetical protein
MMIPVATGIQTVGGRPFWLLSAFSLITGNIKSWKRRRASATEIHQTYDVRALLGGRAESILQWRNVEVSDVKVTADDRRGR